MPTAAPEARHQAPVWLSRLLVSLAAGVAGVAVVAVPGNNNADARVLAGVWAIVGTTVVDVVLVGLLLGSAKAVVPVRVAIAVAVGGLLGNWFRLDPEWAFRTAFGQDPPAEVRDLDVRGIFFGRQSDTMIFFRFRADEATLNAILAGRAFQRDEESEKWLLEPDDWRTAWGLLLGSAGGRWGVPVKPTSPQVYIWRHAPGLPRESVRVVWDAATDQVYAIYAFG